MKPETVDSLLLVFTQLASHSQENWIKLTALERAIQDLEPDTLAVYQGWMMKLRTDPTVQSDHQKTRKVLDSLREALLRE